MMATSLSLSKAQTQQHSKTSMKRWSTFW